MKEPRPDVGGGGDPRGDHGSEGTVALGRVWTVPNALSAIRLVGSPAIVVLAGLEMPQACLGLFLGLLMTDWVDGKLALLLRQQTTIGARLDSYADAIFYACTLIALIWLEFDMLRPEIVWIGLAVASYGVNVLVSWVKFRRVPSYHTRLAKTCWLLIGVAVVAVFADGSIWLLRTAIAVGILTNLEEIAISLVLPDWRVNVVSLYHAVRDRNAAPGDQNG